ncbi:serine/threonine-protein kinase [Catalinimonas niigatensis]|uniref:serine/threonine-protein kinase n=1 Tax=Catalinimonas niigatensis TaxID=1397264 RepID=UPI0026666337|nr:serine/threonine-protein kinase [Catalinimonas niigatensis]WPP49137.1 serine/threonine-protein kinase [Catalinimonas niigatensis]
MEEGEKIVISEQDFRRRFVYDQDSLLGEGGFAKVYKAFDRQFDETVALKFYTKTELQKYDIISEMRNSRRFTHKNIIRVHDARIVRFTNSFGIAEDIQVGILEYANAGNLQDFLNTTPSEEQFKQVVLGILHGLQYLHTEKRVIHRDLSPDNILMIKDHEVWIPKIADFGISKQIDLKTMNMGGKKVSSELVGKMEYMAPEQFDPKKYGIDGQIATNVDLWALGVILTEVFLESSPFGDRNTAQSPMQIMHNVLHNPIPAEIRKIPEPYCKVIKSCLIKDANKRVKSSQDLIYTISSYEPKKKKTYVPLLVAGLFVALLAATGVWYFQKNVINDKTIIAETPISNDDAPKEKFTFQPVDSTIATVDSASADTTAGLGAENNANMDGNEKMPVNITEVDPNGAAVLKSMTNHTGMTSAKKKEFFQDLHREIKSLDNDEIDIFIRRSRINHHINDFFTDNKANVVIQYVNDSIEMKEQDVESFFNYIVNTAEMEVRDWEIDPLKTKLVEDKIATLTVKKL